MSAFHHSIDVVWEKSSHSGSDGGQCIEFSRTVTARGLVPVRDSKDPGGPSLLFSACAWSSFISGVKSGEFMTS
ncbi:DUF397 domain-containing protein [Kitasatospora sp. NPDC097643]|uniref:DUF397 domain-containing protein n=1 Tax=Kitasatospora sp. NPDC097643 TaxID=3157230 RepID=UPI00332FD8B3